MTLCKSILFAYDVHLYYFADSFSELQSKLNSDLDDLLSKQQSSHT